MEYRLISALASDEQWLEYLRRDVYQELFYATWGGWDEARHARHFTECIKRGNISIIEVDGVRVGMIQLFEEPDTVEVGEIQIQPGEQNRGVGTCVLRDTIKNAHQQQKRVFLTVALKNDKAFQLYHRLGFRQVAQTDTHYRMVCEPED
jgi:RimJ/RimL family protein N-acetyltransferase